jgi:mono/diheme cytochrome c family protein
MINTFKCLLKILLALAASSLFSCLGRNSKDGESVKFQQYYVQGQQLYEKRCSNCHQKTGAGLGLVYPPLNSSDFMDNNFSRIACLMKFGIKGELEVNGRSFNKPMPGIPSLTELEIAEISTYIYNTWNHQSGLVETSEVSSLLNQCGN